MAENYVEVVIGSKDDVNLAGPAAKVEAFGRLVSQTNAKLTQSYAASARAQKLLSDPLVKATQDTQAWSKATTDAAGTLSVLGDRTDQAAKKADNLAQSTAKAAGGFSALGGAGGGSGMTYVVGVLAALAPVTATVATGLAGLGVAAYGILKPISMAQQATGGLRANMARLNPEQQTVALGILSLGKTFQGFQAALQPTVLGIFNTGLRLAGNLLHDVEPVAKATGVALNGVLANIGRTFQGGIWQQFFSFMARTAAPDVTLLGKTFTDLMNALPPLVEALQPMSTDLLVISDVIAKLAGGITGLLEPLNSTTQHMNFMQKTTDLLRTVLFAPGAGLLAALKLLHITGGSASAGLGSAGQAAVLAGPKFWSFSAAAKSLNAQMTTLVGNLLTLQGSQLAYTSALQAAETQLKSNTAGLEGNSKNAVANRQAVLAATQAALTFGNQQLSLGKSIDGASKTVEHQIDWLQGLHDKSSFVRQELEALLKLEQRLAAEKLNQTIHVEGLGQWQVSQSLAPGVGHRRAAGGLIPGSGGQDSYPALLQPGELVVPTSMVKAGAVDHLRGQLPGFASGGIVPSYAGAVGGLNPWVKGNDQATIHLIDQAVVSATLAGMRAAQQAASAPGVGGGFGASALQAQAFARSLFGSHGWGMSQWPFLLALWNRESGWNASARNPSSGAAGIPQDITGNFHGGYQGQVIWGENYIGGRYGTPAGAWGHETAFGWYGGGLSGGVFRRPTLIGVGERGPERVDVTPVGGGGQPLTVRVQLEWVGAPSDTLTFLKKTIRVAGGDARILTQKVSTLT